MDLRHRQTSTPIQYQKLRMSLRSWIQLELSISTEGQRAREQAAGADCRCRGMRRRLQRDLHHQDALSQGQRSNLQEEQTSDSDLLSILLCIAFSLSRTDKLRNVLALF